MSQLLWELTRNNNSFLVRRKDRDFTSDPFSNTGVQSFSGLGFIQKKAVSVKANDTKNFVVSFKKRTRFAQKNLAAYKNEKLVNKDQKKSFVVDSIPIKHGVQRAAKVIRKRYGKHRRGLAWQALTKLIKLNKYVTKRQIAAKKAEKEAAGKKK